MVICGQFSLVKSWGQEHLSAFWSVPWTWLVCVSKQKTNGNPAVALNMCNLLGLREGRKQSTFFFSSLLEIDTNPSALGFCLSDGHGGNHFRYRKKSIPWFLIFKLLPKIRTSKLGHLSRNSMGSFGWVGNLRISKPIFRSPSCPVLDMPWSFFNRADGSLGTLWVPTNLRWSRDGSLGTLWVPCCSSSLSAEAGFVWPFGRWKNRRIFFWKVESWLKFGLWLPFWMRFFDLFFVWQQVFFFPTFIFLEFMISSLKKISAKLAAKLHRSEMVTRN